MSTLPTPAPYDPQHLAADERFLLHVIRGGSTSMVEQLERLDNLRQRDVITAGEANRIRHALETDMS